jgi:membrane protease YdiL (CAAX protease family)
MTALLLPVAITAGLNGQLRSGAPRWIVVGNGAFWGVAALVLVIVRFWERRSLASIGLAKPTWKAILLGAAAVVALAIFSVATGAVLTALGFPLGDEQQIRTLAASSIWLQIFVVLSAGATEEILFRGYAIERVLEMTRSRGLGLILPVLAFGTIHIPLWGVAHAIIVGVAGLGFALIYLWGRNLWINITAHVLFDGLTLAALHFTTNYAH